MRHCLLVVVVVVASMLPFGRALARQDGESASEVAVREQPHDDAPVVRTLPAGAHLIAHEHKLGWVRVTGAASGWIHDESFADSEDKAREQSLLAQLAAASDRESEASTDADLMYEALKQWRGEPPDTAKIERVMAQSNKASDRTRRLTREKIKALFWKDPFAEDPHRIVPVRKQDRELLATEGGRPGASVAASPAGAAVGPPADASDRKAMAHLRTQLEKARAQITDARAEIARLRAELSRIRATGGNNGASAEAGGSEFGYVPRQASSGHPRRLAERPDTGVAGRERAQPRLKSFDRPVLITAPAVAAVPPSSEPAPLPPPGMRATDPRGIIVVPLDPVPASPVGSKTARH